MGTTSRPTARDEKRTGGVTWGKMIVIEEDHCKKGYWGIM